MNAEIKAKQLLESRTQCYRRIFESEDGEYLLRDLAKFCRAHDSTFHENERAASRLDGRREVWLRIQHHLKLTEQEIWELYR